jgi:hypothetical protein
MLGRKSYTAEVIDHGLATAVQQSAAYQILTVGYP